MAPAGSVKHPHQLTARIEPGPGPGRTRYRPGRLQASTAPAGQRALIRERYPAARCKRSQAARILSRRARRSPPPPGSDCRRKPAVKSSPARPHGGARMPRTANLRAATHASARPSNRLESAVRLSAVGETAGCRWYLRAKHPEIAGGDVHHVHAVSFRATPSPPSRRQAARSPVAATRLATAPDTQTALSSLGKGLDLRKLVAGAGFEPATSGL